MPGKKNYSIAEVARICGVSKATVSRVINNIPQGVGPETREKVLKTIRELNYRPNALARSVATSKSGTVGLIIPDVSNFFFPTIIRGVTDYMDGCGYNAITTFKDTVKLLNEGNNIVIFPEHNQTHNQIIYDFQDKFIDVARLYFRRTGKEVCFVPMYITPKLKKICLGQPVRFQSTQLIDIERARIRNYLMEQVTKLATELPEHTVIPYRNIPKKLYPSNKPKEVTEHEEARG